MIVSVNACSSGSSDKKYTIYYTNSSRDKLIARDCKIDESASVEEVRLDTLKKISEYCKIPAGKMNVIHKA